MSTAALTRAVPTQFHDEREHRRKLSDAANRLLDGKSNNTGSVTLNANQATTTVTDRRIGDDSAVFFCPSTANAATELGAGGMYVSSRDARAGTFVITHANDANADKTYRYIIVG